MDQARGEKMDEKELIRFLQDHMRIRVSDSDWQIGHNRNKRVEIFLFVEGVELEIDSDTIPLD